MDFSDRFTITNNSFDPSTLPNITEAQLAAASPELAEMVEIVRSYSVLLKKKTALEIYNVITRQSDPRISFILAAARDNLGGQIFSNLNVVKGFMFGTDLANPRISDIVFEEHDVFVDGIRTISCALAASVLIAQLAQIPEQANHAIALEKAALEDLQRILQVPDIAAYDKSVSSSTTDDTASKPGILFEPKTIQIGSRQLRVSIYLSTEITGWASVATYTGSVDTANIVADIADYINSVTTSSSTGNLLASPILAGKNSLHKVEFDSRKRNLEISAEVVIVKLVFVDNQESYLEVPFNWGIDPRYLKPYGINSAIVAVTAGSATSVTTAAEEEATGVLNTLYFRRRTELEDGTIIDLDTAGIQSFTYRISPTMDASETIELVRIVGADEDRPNQLVTLLLDRLYANKDTTKALGSIIHNDPYNSVAPEAALQLSSWTATNKETELILDILDLPIDIEVALGTPLTPLTRFSSKPRSLKIAAAFYKNLESTQLSSEELTANGRAPVAFVKSSKSKLLQLLNDVRDADYINYWDRKTLPVPPYPYHNKPTNEYPYN